MFVFCTSCRGQNKPDLPKEKIKYETKNYEYTDSMGKRLLIQNSFPNGGTKYTDPNGKVWVFASFWSRITNETDNPLELKIDFPVLGVSSKEYSNSEVAKIISKLTNSAIEYINQDHSPSFHYNNQVFLIEFI